MRHLRKERSAQLQALADSQYGYFTAPQAKQFGYTTHDHTYHTKSHNWEHVDAGLFRLPGYPDTLASVFTRWTLWSRNRQGQPQAIISHESARRHHTPAPHPPLPEIVHLTVPLRFQKRCPAGVELHKRELSAAESEAAGTYRVTTPARTAQDLAPAGAQYIAPLSPESLTPDLTMPESSFRLETRALEPQSDASQILTEAWAMSDRHDSPSVTNRPQAFGRPYAIPPPPPPRRLLNLGRRQAGFTLVELLVVVAIISILAGMLLPALGKALDSARQTACANNLKQILNLEIQYAGDYNDCIGANAVWLNPSTLMSWTGWLTGYAHNSSAPRFTPYTLQFELFYCPARRVAPCFNPSMVTDPDKAYWYTYGIVNGSSTQFLNYSNWRPSCNLGKVPQPTQTILLLDTVKYDSGKQFYYCYPTAFGENSGPHLRHANMTEAAFFDGHAESLTSAKLYDKGFKAQIDANLNAAILP